jgi:hypothetical protein
MTRIIALCSLFDLVPDPSFFFFFFFVAFSCAGQVAVDWSGV